MRDGAERKDGRVVRDAGRQDVSSNRTSSRTQWDEDGGLVRRQLCHLLQLHSSLLLIMSGAYFPTETLPHRRPSAARKSNDKGMREVRQVRRRLSWSKVTQRRRRLSKWEHGMDEAQISSGYRIARISLHKHPQQLSTGS